MEREEQIYRQWEKFNEASIQLEQEKISEKEYRGSSCDMGTYIQRDRSTHMLRVRIPGGRMTVSMLKQIVECVKKYGAHKMKITSGQCLQIHDLSSAMLRDLAKDCMDAGLQTIGAGGNNPANIIAPPLSGVDPEGYFDVLPYALAVDNYIMDTIHELHLPRKLKISFADSKKNETHTTFRDLGFAANPDGTFTVYAAGGLGVSPRLGVRVKGHLEPEKILYYVQAMLEIFSENGNYENKRKARSRYLQETLGADKLRDMIRERAGLLEETRDLRFVPEILPVVSEAADRSVEENFRIREQKQKGRYAVYYHPLGGYLPLKRWEDLYETVKDMQDVEIRLSTDGGMYVVNCTAKDAAAVWESTESDAAHSLFCTSSSCVGSSRCTIGAADSQKLLRDCRKVLLERRAHLQLLPRIKISGCISSCAAHQAAELGFQGTRKKIENGTEDAFAVYYGGRETLKQENLTEKRGVILARNIPDFLYDLTTQIYDSKEPGFHEWLQNHREAMEALIQSYQV